MAFTEAFEHINLNEVDTTMKPVEPNVYTLEINKLEPVYRKISKPTSEYCGQEVLVLKGSYTIVDDVTYASRKLWHDFWTPFRGAKIGLKKQMQATGVTQGETETLPEYASKFATLNPPARFQAPVGLKTGSDGSPENEINFFQARPV